MAGGAHSSAVRSEEAAAIYTNVTNATNIDMNTDIANTDIGKTHISIGTGTTSADAVQK